jgi:hypothetical protein
VSKNTKTPPGSAGGGQPANKSYLAALEKAKQDRKVKLWHSRLMFAKTGHSLMQNKLYSEAAKSYEKYLRILELVFECGAGELTPEHFKESAKTAELSMVTSAYWDLLRVYDSNSAYKSRQKKAGEQLSKFAPLTPLLPDLIKKATVFQKQCRNPDVIKDFIASASGKKGRCFIATSAFEDPLSPEVQSLQFFRDRVLRTFSLGRKFILFYYKHSPRWACALDRHRYLKPATRSLLRIVIKCVRLVSH